MKEATGSPCREQAKLRFRPANQLDIVRLVPMVNAAFSVETFLEGTRTDEARLSAMMQKGCILVGEGAAGEDGNAHLIGSIYIETRGRRGYLGMLAVDPAHQRTGLARRLVQAAEERLRQEGCEGVDITVLSLRAELPPIYQRFGYMQTGTEEPRLSQRLKTGAKCHCIVMSKQL